MAIYTSFFSNWRNFPEGSLEISITRFPPKNWTGLELRSLAPSAELLKMYKNKEIDEYMFAQKYIQEISDRGITRGLLNTFFKSLEFDNIILLCYEKKGDFCHRNILASWYGEEIKEL